MDTSETYIKMSEKAPKELTKFDWFDKRQFTVCCYHKCLIEYDEGYHDWRCEKMQAAQDLILYEPNSEKQRDRLWRKLQKSDDWCEGKHWIRLPCQDQLQDMLPDFLNPETTYMSNLLRIIIDDYYKLEKFSSWEQLWLAFVMKELYSKIWNGEDWIVDLKVK